MSHDRAFLDRTVADVVVIDGDHAVERVPGGYAGWRARRDTGALPAGARPAGQPAARRRTATVATDARATAPTRRSPSTVRFQLRGAEKRMRDAEGRRDALVVELANAGDDHRRLAQLGAELVDAEAELSQAEDDWLALGEEGG